MADTNIRDLTVNISLVPSINNRFVEWFIEDLSIDEIDSFLDDLDKLVTKHKGYYTGDK